MDGGVEGGGEGRVEGGVKCGVEGGVNLRHFRNLARGCRGRDPKGLVGGRSH